MIQSVWVRLGLGMLGYEAVLVGLTWLGHQYWILQNVSFGDALFVVGALACAMASAGMLRTPSDSQYSPFGVPAFPVQVTEQERRAQIVADWVEQRSFGTRLLAAGLLCILLSILVTYWLHL